MPITIGSMQDMIKKKEGFDIVFLNQTGRDRKDNAHLRRRYGYLLRAKDTYSVSDWKQKRFQERFPEFDCDVLDGSGNVCDGRMKLGTVRKSYL